MAAREIEYESNRFLISYDIINPSNAKAIVVLHGWGSNKEIMKQAFSKQFPDFKHIYIDMPGFGKSTNDTILTTQEYSKILNHFFQAINIEPLIIIGHSFGGKVATLLNPPCLVLLSSSGILVPKPWSVRLKITLFKLFKIFGLSRFRSLFVSSDAQGMSQVMYETFKNVVDEDFESSFSKFKNKAILFWGKSDTATPLWTAQKINSTINNSVLYPLDGDHYFFLNHTPFISQEITKICKEYDR